MHGPHEGIVQRLAAEAIRLGADFLDVEYNDGYEEVVAAKGGLGHAIARFRSSSREAVALREELHRIVRRKWRIAVGGLSMSCTARSLRASEKIRSGCSCAAFDSGFSGHGNRLLSRPISALITTSPEGTGAPPASSIVTA